MILVTGSSDHSVKLWDCSEEGRRKGMDRSGVIDGHPQRVAHACYDSRGCRSPYNLSHLSHKHMYNCG